MPTDKAWRKRKKEDTHKKYIAVRSLQDRVESAKSFLRELCSKDKKPLTSFTAINQNTKYGIAYIFNFNNSAGNWNICQSQYKIGIHSSQFSTCLSLSCGSGTRANIIRKKVTQALGQFVSASSCLTVTIWELCLRVIFVFWFKVRNCWVTKCLSGCGGDLSGPCHTISRDEKAESY